MSQLRNAPASASRVTEEMKDAAEKEAQIILAEARIEAENIVRQDRLESIE